MQQTCDGIKLHFNMFYEGKLKIVTIDDALAFDGNNSLVCASSSEKDNLYLASFFEKVFLKPACNYSYERCISTNTILAFSCFSECMMCYINYEKEETKENLMIYLTLEIDKFCRCWNSTISRT